MKEYLVIALLAVFTFGCSSSEEPEMESIAYNLIAKGNLYGDGAEGISKQNLVIKDQDSWTTLINKMDTSNVVSDSFTETDIDFTKFIIIAVFDEIKVNDGHEVVLEITTDSESIFVKRIDELTNGNLALVITQPYIITKILKTDSSIIFQ